MMMSLIKIEDLEKELMMSLIQDLRPGQRHKAIAGCTEARRSADGRLYRISS